MIGLCLGLAGSLWAQLPVSHFTLAWDHSIEKIRWEEDYRISAEGLMLQEARVRGNGAGMDIPDDARLDNGSWHFQRRLPPQQPLKLGRAPEAGDYQLCFEGDCQSMSRWVGAPSSAQPFIELWSCETTGKSSFSARSSFAWNPAFPAVLYRRTNGGGIPYDRP